MVKLTAEERNDRIKVLTSMLPSPLGQELRKLILLEKNHQYELGLHDGRLEGDTDVD